MKYLIIFIFNILNLIYTKTNENTNTINNSSQFFILPGNRHKNEVIAKIMSPSDSIKKYEQKPMITVVGVDLKKSIDHIKDQSESYSSNSNSLNDQTFNDNFSTPPPKEFYIPMKNNKVRENYKKTKKNDFELNEDLFNLPQNEIDKKINDYLNGNENNESNHIKNIENNKNYNFSIIKNELKTKNKINDSIKRKYRQKVSNLLNDLKKEIDLISKN